MTICRHQNVRLVLVKIVTMLIDYISIVLGLLVAYKLRLAMPEAIVSSNFSIDIIHLNNIPNVLYLLFFY